MKRSSCLSAILVGLVGLGALSVSATASAAPTAKAPAAKAKPTEPKTEAAASDSPTASPTPVNAVAQDSSGSGTPTTDNGGGTAPSASSPSGTGDGTTATPAISVSSSTTAPVADQPSTAPAQPAAKPKPRPFAGSALYNQTSVTTSTVFRGQQNDYNPTAETSLFILPRFALNEAFQLRARVLLNYEFTNSDSTVTRNEPVISDTTFSLFYRKIPKFLGIQPAVAANIGLPTSKASRARTMFFTPGVTAQFARPFEHFLGGDAMILATAGYSHPIYRSEVQELSVDEAGAPRTQCAGTDCIATTGAMNPSDSLSYIFLFEAEWGKWNPAIYYFGASQWVYKPTDVEVNGKRVESGQSQDPPGVRQSHYFSIWLDYNFNSWFTGEVGYWNARSALTGAGQYANPAQIIFDRYGDTRVYLGASIQLDNFVKALQGGEHGEAGVVRAQNTKQPRKSIWQM